MRQPRRTARLGATAARATCSRVEAAVRGSRLVAGLVGLVLSALALSHAAKLHIGTNAPAPVAYVSSTLLRSWCEQGPTRTRAPHLIAL